MIQLKHNSNSFLATLVLGLFLTCASAAWGDTFTVNSSTTSSDALFGVSETMTNYTYSGYWAADAKLIEMATSASITVTNVTGATITAISVEGVADNNSNKTVNFTGSDGTTSAVTSSGSWNNRKSASLTSKALNSTNVNKFKCDAGQTYTLTNNASSSYQAGVRFVITYTSTLPTSLVNGATTSSTQALSWTAPSTAPANGYLVAYSSSTSTVPANSVTSTTGSYTVVAVEAGTTNMTLSELSGSTTYNWWVRSKNARGNSSWVAGSSFTTESVAPIPTTKTIYLKPGVWKTGESNERFAVYCWYSGGEEWYDMSLFVQNDCDGTVYKAEVDPQYETYIFCRMNNGDAENKWDNRWNQTENMTAVDGEYGEITGWGGGNSPCNWGHQPYNVCVSGTWLAFAGETITLTATCACATHFQWYKNSVAIDGATSATYTKTNCTHEDGGSYYCMAWGAAGEANAKGSNVYSVRVPYLAIQTGGGGDRQDLDFTRASTGDEAAICERYLGVAWDYEMMVIDGIDERGNNGTMTSDNCTNWTMDQVNNSKWCRIHTTKEGTYRFTLSFSNSVYTPVKLSAAYPPMVQTPGLKVYIENTPAMQERGWSNSSIYYRIGKGKYDDGDTRNWTAAQLMTLVPGTARYLYTTTPDWSNDFWVWHIANNAGWVDDKFSIYKTKTEDSYAITESSNFHGDEITTDRTIILNSTSGGYGQDGMNDNCQFYGYTHTPGMITHNASVGATTYGKIKVEYTHYDGTAKSSEAATSRTLSGLAHTCILTITGVPDCGYKIKSLKVSGEDFTSGSTYILDADATITATFEDETYNVTFHTDGGTINSGNITTYKHGIGATLPTDVTKDGKSFGGWYDNSGLTGSPVTSISTTDCGDKEYWVKWTTCPALCSGETLYKFEVNSSVGGGNICSSGNNPQELTTPTQLSALTGGTLEGYITDNNKFNNLTFASGRITYANSDKGVLNITLDCPIREGDLIRFNNYSSSNSKYNYLRHTSNSTSTDQLTLNASKSETEIQQIIAPAAFDGKTELYIVCGARTTGISYFEIIRPFKVTLDAATNGGTVDGNGTKELLAANADVIALTHAKKDGYRFKGWYAAPSGGSPVSDAYTVTECITLYAQFEDCPENGTMYKFEVGTGLTNGSVTANNTSFEFNTSNHLSTLIGGTLTTAGTKASYIKIANTNTISIEDNGAYLKVDMDCALEEGDYIKSTIGGNTVYVTKTASRTSTMVLEVGDLKQKEIPAALVGEKTLYLWKGSGNATISYFEIIRPRRTHITLDGAGAFNSYTTSVTATYEQPMPEIERLPQRVGYVFSGYYDAPGGAGTQYYDGLGHGTQNWDKTVSSCTLYAYWKDPCDVAPTLTTIVPLATIWDGQKVDMSLVKLSCDFDTTGISYSLASYSDNIPGCSFAYFDERIYIQGTPILGNTSVVTKTITFTITNDCSPAHTYTVDATIRIYPADRKARLAYIITGTENGAFNAYSSSDESNSSALLTYLRQFYTVNCVNGYATKDSAAIAEYYKDYDLLIVTDFMETPKGYTNAIGTMIDKKPILSFEAYVAGSNGTNWHINSNPADPSPKTGTMKVLCAGHAIFGDGEGVEVINKPGGVSDTTITVLSSCSDKGLQGFVINEAPDFIFLATVKDANNNRDLIVSCERQMVFQARLLMYCINFNEMGNLTPAGKVVMHQMIDYLLMTDETKVADCSLVFDNGAGNPSGGGDHLWSNPANWAPGYNIVPTPFHPTRIIAECWVNVDDAHAGSVKVNKGRDEYDNVVDGKLIVKPYGGLTVAGMVATVKDTRYASPITIKAEDLLIEADETHNGAFVYGNKESDVRATVQYYSRGTGAKTANPEWQYMGIPFRASQTAIGMFRDAWMCRWSKGSTDGLGGLWQWVENEDVLVPFEGYCITQEAKKTYQFAGKLNAPITTTIDLDNREMDDGYAFAANSWTAPIKIQEMQDADFTNAEKAIYIYHTGSYKDYGDHGGATAISAKDGGAGLLAGQYAVVPIHSSPYLTGADSVIPAMQGFFIKVLDKTQEANIKLVYNRVVYDATYFKTSTQPMRAPRRSRASGAPQVMQIALTGAHFGDKVYILSRPDFSDDFEDGWDGRKVEGNADAPMLSVVKQAGEMSVAAVNELDGRYLSFRAGEDTEYTFAFDYEGETLYLYDLFTQQATEIKTGNTYSFEATDRTPSQRFLITATPPRMPTGVETVESEKVYQPKKFIRDGQLLILHRDAVYDALGTRVEFRKEGAQ